MPKVSVIVPVYNVEKYLRRCIDSLLKQTLSDIQIILVDDESPDNCPQICDDYSRTYNNIEVVHKKNGGLGYARNSGLAVAKGEYVSFIDSDDYVDPDMMEKLYSECIRGGYDAVYSEFNVDDYPGFRVSLKPEKEYRGQQIQDLILDIVGAEPSFKSSVKFQCSSCKALYSLRLINNKKILFKSEREYISEDFLFNLDFLFCANKVKYVPFQFYHYCKNDQSLSHTYRPDRWEKQLKMLNVINGYCNRFDSTNEFSLRLARTCLFYSSGALRQHVNRNDIGFFSKIEAMKTVLREEWVVKSLNDYPINKLPLRWLIIAFLMKYKYSFILIFLLKLKR